MSLIFTTLAWFAYSGLSSLDTEIGVKAWYIELSKNGEAVSNNVVISIPTIYPGMDTITEKINIQNHGDSIAQVKYDILSARILDTEYNTEGNNNITSNDLYPGGAELHVGSGRASNGNNDIPQEEEINEEFRTGLEYNSSSKDYHEIKEGSTSGNNDDALEVPRVVEGDISSVKIIQ